MTKPLITIGITCFNAQNTIVRALESALRQDWDNKEILIIDDASTDNSFQELTKICVANKSIRLYKHDINSGCGAARATLLSKAQGEFIVFFDDDDVSDPERTRIQLKTILEAEGKLKSKNIACYASGKRIYPNGYIYDIRAIGRHQIVPRGEAVADRILYFGHQNKAWCYGGSPSCSLMIRVETLKKVGGFDKNFRRVEDLDFAVRLALSGGYFIGTTIPLFTQYATSAPDKSHDNNLKSELDLISKHKRYLESKGVFFYAYNWQKLRYYHFTKQYFCFLKTAFSLLIRHPYRTACHLPLSSVKRLIHEIKIRPK